MKRASYPPNVTGNEPEIVGGAEGLCEYCLAMADGGVPVAEAVITIHREPSCLDCLKEHITSDGIDWDELVKLIKEIE